MATGECSGVPPNELPLANPAAKVAKAATAIAAVWAVMRLGISGNHFQKLVFRSSPLGCMTSTSSKTKGSSLRPSCSDRACVAHHCPEGALSGAADGSGERLSSELRDRFSCAVSLAWQQTHNQPRASLRDSTSITRCCSAGTKVCCFGGSSKGLGPPSRCSCTAPDKQSW